MTSPPAPPRQDRKWYELSLRHLRMSSRLLEVFPDGSVFHTYHAFECAVAAVIAAKGWPIPPQGSTVIYAPRRIVYHGPRGQLNEQSSHKAKLELFDQVADRTKPYYATFSTLKRYLTNPLRNDTLYYDSNNDLLPRQRFSRVQASGLYQQVRNWVKEVRVEIP